MSTISQLTTVPADVIVPQTAQPAVPAPAQNAATPAPKAQEEAAAAAGSHVSADGDRLLIQEGAEVGVFIYTILDRTSGRVLAQIPREEVLQLAQRPDYEAGQVINTNA